ncbi:MAG: diphosphate--fructose-6-phosphate 1-phosphotransferase [Spirochaetes bacterium GWF1_31_7]|nr:MAG: diphosphate--fructose-6-phosphate 1-phosphotransferase [Spirochaetes bacterium GWE1_32_154]OHD45686.1 MAG: diphosphate--fructose-6-phosphate 1-phosphotransferase [Spirochaetes bacterium GWE2_31_10]OHD47680.1 MAG: diphosphate--fructose-6-phosphate 1-phosphotransferase [Spirochaetes bacterium GWF1_31_7]HBD94783.1 ATP-dependent 6-phosphofructokinase [Spirochaetia bacterium]
MKYDYDKLLKFDLNIKNHGKSKYESPLNRVIMSTEDHKMSFVTDEERILVINSQNEYEEWKKKGIQIPSFEKAGPREKIFFEPGETISAVVTCGGLCPGLNSVIRALVYMNYYRYNNKITYGIRYGYEGFIDEYDHEILNLTPGTVENIHKIGGTVLGSSRGPQSEMSIVDKLVKLKVNVLYVIGGDGTLRGASKLTKEIENRNLKISVIGIPKTIDNDIAYIDKSFGSETAFSKACDAIDAAHIESKGAPNGIGIVKVMGRHSGFIAANATLATNDVNFLLVPEMKFHFDGPKGFLAALKKRLDRSSHAVILVAEGAGQEYFDGAEKKLDPSGNEKLNDIGLLLKDKIKNFLAKEKIPTSIKYIDPSYIIRSTPPTPNDSIFCLQLAQKAVHAGMCGKTNVVIGFFNGEFIHLPIDVAVSERKVLQADSELWLSVLESTGQPITFINNEIGTI